MDEAVSPRKRTRIAVERPIAPRTLGNRCHPRNFRLLLSHRSRSHPSSPGCGFDGCFSLRNLSRPRSAPLYPRHPVDYRFVILLGEGSADPWRWQILSPLAVSGVDRDQYPRHRHPLLFCPHPVQSTLRFAGVFDPSLAFPRAPTGLEKYYPCHPRDVSREFRLDSDLARDPPKQPDWLGLRWLCGDCRTTGAIDRLVEFDARVTSELSRDRSPASGYRFGLGGDRVFRLVCPSFLPGTQTADVRPGNALLDSSFRRGGGGFLGCDVGVDLRQWKRLNPRPPVWIYLLSRLGDFGGNLSGCLPATGFVPDGVPQKKFLDRDCRVCWVFGEFNGHLEFGLLTNPSLRFDSRFN